ncbi:MAG: GNAT family N-acetyltransferase [Candidatus Rokubacteria bacterium]|nr:GNAT family N-acetyltransferase [Candidatus Rokubacteria bacterium]
MSGVRPLVPDADLPQVADLHQLVFGRGEQAPPGPRAAYLGDVFLGNPWRDAALPSLVYEDDDGRIVGFLGVVPRPMVMNGQPVKAAIASQFMVHPRSRGRVGLQLARAFLSGAQDVSLTEGADAVRAIWERLGATTLLLYSIRWTRPLRPGRYALSFLGRHGGTPAVARALTPVCAAAERVLGRLGGQPFRPPAPAVAGEALTEGAFVAGLPEATRRRSVRPEYDERSAGWLFATLAGRTGCGRLRKVFVRDAAGEAAGWYVYVLKPGAVSEVMQVVTRQDAMRDVLGHLFHDAWTHGAVAVSGQLDPGSLQAFAAARCLFHGSGGSWVLAHAKRPACLEPFERGQAWLTRLEGEWWVGFTADAEERRASSFRTEVAG